jgi:hypothetical protein
MICPAHYPAFWQRWWRPQEIDQGKPNVQGVEVKGKDEIAALFGFL